MLLRFTRRPLPPPGDAALQGAAPRGLRRIIFNSHGIYRRADRRRV